MNSAAFDIASIIDAAGFADLGGNSKWALTVNQMPIDPPDSMTVYDSGGFETELYSTGETPQDRPTIQIKIRGEDHQETWEKVKQVADYLLTLTEYDFSTTRYIGIWQTTGILSLGTDDDNRYIFTVNFRILRQEN